MRLFADRYEIQHCLGTGGMAEVWQARDTRLDRDVAIKVVHRSMVDRIAAQRFTREAYAVAKVTHPTIVAIYDAGTHDGRPYLVMELVDGHTVRRLLDNGLLPVTSAVDIAIGVCQALEAAHRAGIIHRDIKPGNVIRTPAGTVKILDFGIAKSLHTETDTLTDDAAVVGTSHYLAPERILGQAADARSDLYSLGCLLYEMLAVDPPFDADNPLGVLHQHLHTVPTPVDHRAPCTPPAVADLVMHLLAKNPTDRPASAAEVADNLRAALDDQPPHNPTKVYPTLPDAPRSRRWRAGVLIATATVLAVLMLVTGVALWPDDEPAARQVSRDTPTSAPKGGFASLESNHTNDSKRSPVTRPRRQKPHTAGPAIRLGQLRRTLDRQVAAGNVHSDAADKIRDDLVKIREKHREGKNSDAAAHTDELDRRLDELAREGKLTGNAHPTLAKATTRLASSLT